MSKLFNLFLLHSVQDFHPRTWICFKGKRLRKIITQIEAEVTITKNITREKLSRDMAKKFKCSTGVIKRILQGKSEFYPIPIVNELLNKSEDKKSFQLKIAQNIEWLKVNSASSKPVKAVKSISEELAKILGAFMADGSLSVQVVVEDKEKERLSNVEELLKQLGISFSSGNSSTRGKGYLAFQQTKVAHKVMQEITKSNLLLQHHYNIELTEEYRDSVEAFNQWIENIFNIKPTSFGKKKNAWRAIYSNKILARYLTNYFEVIPGPKTFTAFEPKIIKESPHRIRLMFARGVLMFDGCVNKAGKIIFSSKSKFLYESINNIWKRDKIDFGGSQNKRKEWVLFTTSHNKKKELFKYFEIGTQKHKLLGWINGDKSNLPIIKVNAKHLSAEKLIKVIQTVKICDMDFLEKTLSRRYSTVKWYLNILKNQLKITVSTAPKSIGEYVNQCTGIMLKNHWHNCLFKKVRQKFIKDKNLATLLQVKISTFSNWKRRKSRIPFHFLKDIHKALGLPIYKISENIKSTDREIIEIID